MTEDPTLNSVNSVKVFAFDIFKPVPVTSSSADSLYLLARLLFYTVLEQDSGVGSGEDYSFYLWQSVISVVCERQKPGIF